MKFQQIAVISIAFVLMMGITIFAGAYGKTNAVNEKVSFSMATHAGNISATKVVRGPGPVITMSPIVVDLDSRGILKSIIQPMVESVSTKSIYNYGKQNVTIHMEMTNATLPIEWIVTANYPYDPVNHTFTKPLAPGKSITGLSLEIRFIMDAEAWQRTVVYNGGLRLTEASNGTLLTFLPIQIIHGSAGSGGSFECCGLIGRGIEWI
jgi:hypothetical protein